jgi:hypothetical protein
MFSHFGYEYVTGSIGCTKQRCLAQEGIARLKAIARRALSRLTPML